MLIILDGQGADEILAGYHYFFGFYFKDLLKQLKASRPDQEVLDYLKLPGIYRLKAWLIFFCRLLCVKEPWLNRKAICLILL